MSRYIDADDVLTQRIGKEFNNTYEQGKVQGWNDAIDYIGNFAPTADVRENARGKWEYNAFADNWRCDQCYQSNNHQTNFCPNCGALMSESLKWHEIGKSVVDGIQAGIKEVEK